VDSDKAKEMIGHKMFIAEMRQLCLAFRKRMEVELIWLYYRAFANLTEVQVKQLFQWAIDNVETGFPTIATLKNHATSQGWYKSNRPSSEPERFVYIICPDCSGSFAISRQQLEKDALAGRTYRCINSDQWHCPVTFSARTILERENQ
jgi:hypothetical protein